MIKAVFFDVDGTLLSHNQKKIPESTCEVIKLMQEKGIRVYLATGRHLSELKELPVLDIRYDGYITLNGQIVLDAEQKVLFDKPFTKDMTDKMISIFNKKEIPLVLVEEEELYINFVNDKVIESQQAISSSVPPVHPYDGKPVYMATTYLEKDQEEQFINDLPKGLGLVRWQNGAFDIIMEGGGKVEGIRKVIEYLGITQDEIMAFGDAGNDITMLEFAGIGVAMGNADEETKKHADYVTAHIDDDGVMKALKHFKVI